MITATKALEMSKANCKRIVDDFTITSLKTAKKKLKFYKRKINNEIRHCINIGIVETKITVEMSYFRTIYPQDTIMHLKEWVQPWISKGYKIEIPDSIAYIHYQPIIISWKEDD